MRFFAATALAALTIGAASVQAEEASYILATASTGGTYYPVGVAISTLVKVKLEPTEKIAMAAISSAGSAENVRLIRDGEAQFGILQALYGYDAITGTGSFAEIGKQENLRSVTMLWPNVEHFIIDAAAVKTGTVEDIADLKGKAMAFGSQNSGTIGSNRTILAGLGLDLDKDYELVFGGYGPSAEALQNGQVEGVSIPAGIPAGAVSQLFAAAGDKVKMLEFTPEQIEKADGGRGIWTSFVVPEGTYPGQAADITTIAQPNFLAVDASVSEDNIYQITRTIYENLPFLQAIHPATKHMILEQAITGLPVPLHPGAARYFQEAGIEIPENLIAK
ncbi:TAXI family TRAP transporter solute-binding subunit [Paracoccus sp. (in: a-proteobacteria)]|uniref:TAXI family TRAP transporter solute-binding subunit n=1 Tax=Paracoccus sp. TaxID=267 RepID=UPI003A87FFE4